MATQEIINIGTLPNDGEGDPLRVAFAKINNNFSNLRGSTTMKVTSKFSFLLFERLVLPHQRKLWR